MSEKLEKRLHELRDQAKLFAKAESDRVYLENFKHAKLAMLMKKAESLGANTVAAQEREARSNPEYLEVLEGLREATRVAEENKWLLRIAMRGTSLWQSEMATMRAEMQSYGVKE